MTGTEKVAQDALKHIRRVHARIRQKPKPGTNQLSAEEAANLMYNLATLALDTIKKG